LAGQKSHDLSHFAAIFQTPFPAAPPVVQIGFASLSRLSDWQRQCLHPAQHASKQASREMALRQHQPAASGELDQSSAGSYKSLMQVGQRPERTV